MSVSFLSRCRPVRALLPLFALCAALAGCAGVSDTISPAFVDPARYDLWDCKQLAPERKNVVKRTEDLERLMAKAETGTGGVVVAELAYRNDYLAARGQQKLIEETWFDHAGNWHTENVHVVERYSPIDRDHIQYEATIEDPSVFTRPWKMSMPLYRILDKNAEIFEWDCRFDQDSQKYKDAVPK